MDVHRIEGIKYNFDTMSEDEIEGVHGHLLETHARLVGEIALIEDVLFARRHPQLDFVENGAAMDPTEVWERYTEAVRDV